jgi:universal stress protein E
MSAEQAVNAVPRRAAEALSSILVVAEGEPEDAGVLSKAGKLAGHGGAHIELFRCESELEYSLRHAYESSGADRARRDAVSAARNYLESLRVSVGLGAERVSTDAACDSPLCEGVLHKVLQSHPDMVVKSARDEGGRRRFIVDPNDWQLIRTCPVPLMLTSGRAWAVPPRFAAAVDVSEEETPRLTRAILQTCRALVQGCQGALDLLYCEPSGAEPEVAARHAATLYSLAEEFQVSADRVHMLTGDFAMALPEFAGAQSYDVLALGALTHKRSLAAPVGTLTGRLIDSLDCDFLLVKAPEGIPPSAQT